MNPIVQKVYDLGGHVVSVHLAEKTREEDTLDSVVTIRDDEPLYFVAYVPLPGFDTTTEGYPIPGSKTLQGYRGDSEQEAATHALQSLKELREDKKAGEKTLKCSLCGSTMHRDMRETTVGYRTVILTYEQPGWYCEECEDVVYNGADAAVAEETFLKAKAQYQELNDALNRIIRD